MSSNPKAKKLPGEQDEMRRDQKLQAVILADSFSTSFRPITLKLPKVLLPLVNAPMLSYTIEFLLLNGVEEVSDKSKTIVIQSFDSCSTIIDATSYLYFAFGTPKCFKTTSLPS